MAVLAHVCRLNMGRVFAGRGSTVMATHTVAADITMIETRHGEQTRVMAVSAIMATANMIGRFAHSRYAIVTTLAGTTHRIMINPYTRVPTP